MNASTEEAREALRREHGVRPVTAAEEGQAASDLPPGLYGFTSSPGLASPLFSAHRYRNFEVHRLVNGPAVVGFVTAADAAKLTGNAPAPVEIRLFPDAEGDASTIVAIGYERIVLHRQYSVRNAESIVLSVARAGAHLAAV